MRCKLSDPCATLQDALALVQPLIDSGRLKKVMDEAGKTIENFGAFGGWKNNIGNFTPGKVTNTSHQPDRNDSNGL